MMNKMSIEPTIVTVDEFGTGFVKNIISPYYFIEFEDGIKRVVHKDKVNTKVAKMKGENDD